MQTSCRFAPGQKIRPLLYKQLGNNGWYTPEYAFRVSLPTEAPDGMPIRPSLVLPQAWAIHIQVSKALSAHTETIERVWSCWQWERDFEPVEALKRE